MNFQVSDSKYSSRMPRNRRAFQVMADHSTSIVSTTTSKSHQFKDHYRHHNVEATSERQKRSFLPNVNSWKERKQFIRYVHCLCAHHKRVSFDFWYFNWFMHGMEIKMLQPLFCISQSNIQCISKILATEWEKKVERFP